MNEPEQITAPTPKRRRSFLREILETLALTVAIFFVVRVALQNFKVEGESMMPNLHNGEYILVDKFDYLVHPPERGDIVVFHAVPADQPNRDFIKRVIALPGELVSIQHGYVYVNRHKLHEPFIRDLENHDFSQARVPNNSYFVLGDNRNNSFDSSRWPTPFLNRRDIIGKAWVAYWPPSDLNLFHTPSFAAK